MESQEITPQSMFYIVETNYASGDSVLFWRPKRCGYTTNLNEAGMYYKDDAEDISSTRPGTFAVLCATVYAMRHPVVSRDKLIELRRVPAFPLAKGSK